MFGPYIKVTEADDEHLKSLSDSQGSPRTWCSMVKYPGGRHSLFTHSPINDRGMTVEKDALIYLLEKIIDDIKKDPGTYYIGDN